MNEKEAAAFQRVRLYINAWIDEYGEKGFIPRIGHLPSLAIADLKLVVDKLEKECLWAVGSAFRFVDDDDVFYDIVKTYPSEQAAREAAGAAGLVALWWDDNGLDSRWMPLA